MEAGQLPPPSVNGGGAAGGGGASAYVVEGWLYKRSSSHVHMKDKFLKRWFMTERVHEVTAGPGSMRSTRCDCCGMA